MNFPAGLIVLILCAIGYWFSWKSLAQQKKTLALFLLVFIGLVLRLYLSSDFYLHFWDERYHALVAKNMMGHPLVPMLYENPVFPFSYQDWSGNHIWVHKQPMPLWSMSISMLLFGVNEIALRLPSVLMSTMGIVITYRIAKHFFNIRTAFVAAFLFSSNGLIIEMTSGRVATDHIDTTFLFFIQAAVLMALEFAKYKRVIFNIICGVFIGFAILTKWLPALIVVPIWGLALMYYKSYKPKLVFAHLLLLLSVVAIVALPWQIYIHKMFPQEAIWEAEFNRKHFTEALDGQSGPFYYYFDKVRLIFGEVSLLALLFLLLIISKKRWRPKFWIFALWIFVPIVVFSLAATKMQGYILFIAPAVFITGAYFWDFLRNRIHTQRYKWFSVLVLILFIALPIRYSIERLKPFDQSERRPIWVSQLKELGKKTNDEKGIIFNVAHPIEAMFYTDLVAYERLPKVEVLDSLMGEGYTIFINKNGGIDEDVYSEKKYQFVSIAEN
jgi:4-amino-4-deoxy-L-arabinose transferase